MSIGGAWWTRARRCPSTAVSSARSAELRSPAAASNGTSTMDPTAAEVSEAEVTVEAELTVNQYTPSMMVPALAGRYGSTRAMPSPGNPGIGGTRTALSRSATFGRNMSRVSRLTRTRPRSP